LRRLVRGPEEAQRLLTLSYEEAERLKRLVADLLEYARPREPKLLPGDLVLIVDEAVAAVKRDPALPHAPSASLEIPLPDPPRPPPAGAPPPPPPPGLGQPAPHRLPARAPRGARPRPRRAERRRSRWGTPPRPRRGPPPRRQRRPSRPRRGGATDLRPLLHHP